MEKARAEEMLDFGKMGVYEYCKRSDMGEWSNGKLIKTMWVDVNNLTEEHPRLLSSFVGMEYNDSNTDEVYAPTPPFITFSLAVSRAATIRRDETEKANGNGH